MSFHELRDEDRYPKDAPNPHAFEAVMQALRKGASRAGAARAAGISTETLEGWLAKGQQGAPVGAWYDFARATIKAESDGYHALGALEPPPCLLESKEVRAQLCSALRRGLTRAEAAEEVGVSPRVLQRWLLEGESSEGLPAKLLLDVVAAEV